MTNVRPEFLKLHEHYETVGKERLDFVFKCGDVLRKHAAGEPQRAVHQNPHLRQVLLDVRLHGRDRSRSAQAVAPLRTPENGTLETLRKNLLVNSKHLLRVLYQPPGQDMQPGEGLCLEPGLADALKLAGTAA